MGLIHEADARGDDEPCSYLNPVKYMKDSNGNCILVPQNSIGSSQITSASTSEPCSYLNPTNFVRDSNGNCVKISSGPTTGVSQARSTSEPCSYLNPGKYVRDSNGNCMLVPQIAQPTPSAPTSSNSLPVQNVSMSGVAVIMVMGFLVLIAMKIYGGKSSSRMRWQPRQYQTKRQWEF